MKFKRGDTFDFVGPVTVQDLDENQLPLAGWSVASDIRFPDSQYLAHLDATLDTNNTVLRLRSTDTRNWPLGAADIDVQFTLPGGDVVSTDTLRIEIVADVTRA